MAHPDVKAAWLSLFVVFVTGPSRSSAPQAPETLHESASAHAPVSAGGGDGLVQVGTLGDSHDPRVRMAKIVLNQVGDLVDNVTQGIASNQSAVHPAQANQRLLDSATSVTTDIFQNTRVEGRLLFSSPRVDPNSPIGVYAKNSMTQISEPEAVRRTASVLKSAIHVFQSLSAGTSSEAQRSMDVLGDLAEQVRGALYSSVGRSGGEPLDVFA